MKFARLAQYLEKLEKTAGRNDMMAILADLFKESDADDGQLIAYLIQGNLGPAYNAPDFGMAEKQVLKAIKRLSDEAETIYKREGDMGLAAEKIKSQMTNHPTSPKTSLGASKSNIQEIHKKLMEIAEASGNGSQEEKIKLLSDLVIKLSPQEAKYAVKIVLGKLRGGFSEMTVLDSLSYMLTGDKSLRENIEKIYNVRADLGEVVKIVKTHNLQLNAYKTTPEYGTPVIMAKAERATQASQIWERNGRCAVEYKLDGLRIQAHITNSTIKLFSRGLENVTAMYPDVVAGLAKQIHRDCIVEGEMIAVGKDGRTLEFSKTMNRKRKYDIENKAAEIPMAIFLFDALDIDGENIIDLVNEERWEKLQKMVGKGEIVKMMPRIIAEKVQDINDFFKKALAEGMEGIVAKRLDAPYTPGSRDFSWIKMKPVLDSVDVVVMGYSAGEGKRTDFGIGEFLVGVYNPKSDKFMTVSKVGSGATDKEWVRLRRDLEKLIVEEKPSRYEVAKQYDQDFWVRPEMVLEIAASEISVSPQHTSGYGLRFPRLIAWREKKPEQATTVAEIERMYTLAKKGGDN